MMTQDPKNKPEGTEPEEQEALARRDFLVGIAKWSTAVIGGVALAGGLGGSRSAEAGAWVNRRGGIGIGGGGSWVNVR
jgi:hypothetical protein